MNKFGFFAVALVVASACIVSAAPNSGLEGKHHGHKHHGSKHEKDFEIQHEPIRHQHHHECHCPEFLYREPAFHVLKHSNKHGHGSGHGHHGHHDHHDHHDHHGQHGHNHGSGQGHHGHDHGIGQGHHGHDHGIGHGHHGHSFKGRSGSASSILGDLERSRGSLRVQEDERDSVHAEGHKASSKLAAAGVVAGATHKQHNDDLALKKHQTINNDKTVIVDKSSGSNDVELNRHVNDNKLSGGFASGVVGAKAGSASGRFDAERDNERDFEANNSRFRERDAVESLDF